MFYFIVFNVIKHVTCTMFYVIFPFLILKETKDEFLEKEKVQRCLSSTHKVKVTIGTSNT